VLPPLPDGLVRRPVRIRDLRDAGVSPAELRGALWQRPARGVRLWGNDQEIADPAVRAHAVAVGPPQDAALTCWAAAYLLGVTDLDGVAWTKQGESQLDVHVVRTAARSRIRRPGVTTVRSQLSPSDVVEVDGVRVTSPVRTTFELLRRGPLVEAVVAADAMLHAGLLSVSDLRTYIDQRPRWRGVPAVRRALALANAAAESPMETRLRLILVLAGFSQLQVNVPLYERCTALFLGRPDLLEEEAGLIIEYDGSGHRQADRHRSDNAREHGLERAGLIVLRFDGHDVFVTPDRTLDVAHAARQRGLDRDRRRDSWTRSPIPWWMEDE